MGLIRQIVDQYGNLLIGVLLVSAAVFCAKYDRYGYDRTKMPPKRGRSRWIF